jgi:DNA polymerase-1
LTPAAFREANNTAIQGTGADMMKLAMVEVYKRIDHKRAKLVLQVHDEIMLEVDEDYKEECCKIVKEGMESCIQFSIPIIAEPKIISRWGEAKS